MGFHIPTEVLIVAWTWLLAVVLIIGHICPAVSQGRAQRGAGGLWISRHPRRQGHGTVILPMVENCRELSLELMSFDVAPQQDSTPSRASP